MGRGVVLILNNEIFDDANISERKNTTHDVVALEEVFFNFDCKVSTVINPTLKDIRDNLNELLIEHLTSASCLVVILMTHGYENDHAFAKDQTYNIGEEILKSKAFQEFPELPKILIVQACKNVDKKKKFQTTTTAEYYPTPTVYNTFRFNSCFEGGKSVRVDRGSIFIQRLCENLARYGFEEDIESIAINRVNKEFETDFKRTGIKQSPTILKYNKGFREFCFGNHVQKTNISEESANKYLPG